MPRSRNRGTFKREGPSIEQTGWISAVPAILRLPLACLRYHRLGRHRTAYQCLALTLLSLWQAVQAQAPEAIGAQDADAPRWAAVAARPDGTSYALRTARTEMDALDRALDGCGADCAHVGDAFELGCLAVSVSRNDTGAWNGVHVGAGATRIPAWDNALEACHRDSDACSVVEMQCPTEVFATPMESDICDGKPEGASCWMEVSNRAGCYIWNDRWREKETVMWFGLCADDGLVRGNTRLVWDLWGDTFTIGDHISQTRAHGTVLDGRRNGYWLLAGNEVTAEGRYLDGFRHGQWRISASDGTQERGAFARGRREGAWTVRHPDGSVEQALYLDGERQD